MCKIALFERRVKMRKQKIVDKAQASLDLKYPYETKVVPFYFLYFFIFFIILISIHTILSRF